MVPETGLVSGFSIMLDRKIYNLRLSRIFGLYLFLPVEAKKWRPVKPSGRHLDI